MCVFCCSQNWELLKELTSGRTVVQEGVRSVCASQLANTDWGTLFSSDTWKLQKKEKNVCLNCDQVGRISFCDTEWRRSSGKTVSAPEISCTAGKACRRERKSIVGAYLSSALPIFWFCIPSSSTEDPNNNFETRCLVASWIQMPVFCCAVSSIRRA